MSQIEVIPPLPEYSSSPPPDYNVTAVATERVIASNAYGNGSSASISPAGSALDVISATHSLNASRASLLASPSGSVSSRQPSSVHHAVYSNSHIFLILPRYGGTSSRQRSPPLPAYGCQATVSGSLSLASGSWISTISKVAVSLEGRASSVVIQQGMRQPASSRKLFSTAQTLWKNTTENALNPPDKPMKFELLFPKSIPGGRDGYIDLPPTFDQETQMSFGAAVHVKIEYYLRVDVWRRGLRSHKSLIVPLLYLPKTYPAPDHMPPVPRLSVMDAKRFGLESEKWRQVDLNMPRCWSPDESWSVSVALPKETTNPSCRPIPIVMTVSRPAPPITSTPSSSSSLMESRGLVTFSEGHTIHLSPEVAAFKESFDFQITLIKHIKLHCSRPHPGRDWASDRVLGEALVRKITVDTEAPKNGLGPRVVTTIHACLRGGVERGETTWALDGFASVEYAIRIVVSSRAGADCRVEREEPLLVTTHGPCDFPEDDPQGPALRMLQQ